MLTHEYIYLAILQFVDTDELPAIQTAVLIETLKALGAEVTWSYVPFQLSVF